MWSRIRTLTRFLYPRLNKYRSLSLGLVFSWPFHKQVEKEPDDPKTITKQLFIRSLWSISRGEFVQADQELHRLLKHIAEAYEQRQIDASTYSEQRGRICSELANVNLLLQKFPEAEALIKQTVQDCVRAGLNSTDAVVVELSLKLALIYEKMGRLEESAIGFQYCIRTQEKKLAAGSVTDPVQLANEKALLGMSYNYFSHFLYGQNELTMALDYAKKALDIAQELYPSTHPNCVHLQSDLAAILLDLNRLDEARAVLAHASQFAQPAGSSPDTNMPADGHCNLLLQCVSLEAMSGDRTKARKLWSEAEKVCGKLQRAPELQARLNKLKCSYNL